MKKLVSANSIGYIGKISEIRFHLSLIANTNISLYDYIKQQSLLYKNSLN